MVFTGSSVKVGAFRPWGKQEGFSFLPQRERVIRVNRMQLGANSQNLNGFSAWRCWGFIVAVLVSGSVSWVYVIQNHVRLGFLKYTQWQWILESVSPQQEKAVPASTSGISIPDVLQPVPSPHPTPGSCCRYGQRKVLSAQWRSLPPACPSRNRAQ